MDPIQTPVLTYNTVISQVHLFSPPFKYNDQRGNKAILQPYLGDKLSVKGPDEQDNKARGTGMAPTDPMPK